MGIFELFLLAVGLSMDAFAVSVCKGLSAGGSPCPMPSPPDCGSAGFRA